MTANVEDANAPVAVDQLTDEQLVEALDLASVRVEIADAAYTAAAKEKEDAREDYDNKLTEHQRRQGLSEEQARLSKIKWGTYQRVLSEKGASFRWTDFHADYPELFEAVVKVEMTVKRELDEKKVEELVEENPALLPIFQSYAIPGKIVSSIRKRGKNDSDD